MQTQTESKADRMAAETGKAVEFDCRFVEAGCGSKACNLYANGKLYEQGPVGGDEEEAYTSLVELITSRHERNGEHTEAVAWLTANTARLTN